MAMMQAMGKPQLASAAMICCSGCRCAQVSSSPAKPTTAHEVPPARERGRAIEDVHDRPAVGDRRRHARALRRRGAPTLHTAVDWTRRSLAPVSSQGLTHASAAVSAQGQVRDARGAQPVPAPEAARRRGLSLREWRVSFASLEETAARHRVPQASAIVCCCCSLHACVGLIILIATLLGGTTAVAHGHGLSPRGNSSRGCATARRWARARAPRLVERTRHRYVQSPPPPPRSPPPAPPSPPPPRPAARKPRKAPLGAAAATAQPAAQPATAATSATAAAQPKPPPPPPPPPPPRPLRPPRSRTSRRWASRSECVYACFKYVCYVNPSPRTWSWPDRPRERAGRRRWRPRRAPG